MSELEMVVKYLEKCGSKVVDSFYYHETGVISVSGAGIVIGVVEGYLAKDAYFFGNINIVAGIAGTVVLTNENSLDIDFYTVLKGREDAAYVSRKMGVNCEMSLMGNGVYWGSRRLYGVGCSSVMVVKNGFGAATFSVRFGFNGFLFVMK